MRNCSYVQSVSSWFYKETFRKTDLGIDLIANAFQGSIRNARLFTIFSSFIFYFHHLSFQKTERWVFLLTLKGWFKLFILFVERRAPRGSVVKCLTRNPGVLGSSRTGSSEFFHWSVLGHGTSEPSLVLMKPRKDMNNVSCRRAMTEILLKASQNTIHSINHHSKDGFTSGHSIQCKMLLVRLHVYKSIKTYSLYKLFIYLQVGH